MIVTFVFRTCLAVVLVRHVCGVSFLRKKYWNASLQVSTKYGILQGLEMRTYHGKQYFLYEGIPFARPPVGYLRFRSPRPAQKWKGVLDATKEGSNCVEISTGDIGNGIKFAGSEDCLYMNIYSPVSPSNTEKTLPVFVFIYGGGFIYGSASRKFYGPDYLLAQDIVVVTFNYRLNVFGFLSTEDEASPGNYGLKDQNFALKWVKDNIRQFGGDPKRVTLCGQSAGAVSVMYHMVSPQSRGLFNGAIALSGDTLTLWSIQRFPRRIARDLGLFFGVENKTSADLVEHLRSLSTDDLKSAVFGILVADTIYVLDNGLPFTPVIEKPGPEAFVTELSYQSLKEGRLARVPLMIGFTNKEVNSFIEGIKLAQPLLLLHDLSPSMIPMSMNIRNKAQQRQVGEMIKRKYFKNKAISSGSSEELVDYFTDILYVRPITKTIKLASKYTDVYSYVYEKELPKIKAMAKEMGFPIDVHLNGVGHALDMACLWKFPPLDLTSDMMDFCHRMMHLWSSFVWHGKPTLGEDPHQQYPEWPLVTDPNNITYLTIDDTMRLGQNYRKEYMDFWDKIFINYSKEPYYTY